MRVRARARVCVILCVSVRLAFGRYREPRAVHAERLEDAVSKEHVQRPAADHLF